MNLKCEGIVLGGFSFGESHKVLTFFTQDHGLLKAVAHGIRKPTSKFGSSMEMLNRVELVLNLSKKNDLHSIKEYTLISSRQSIRENVENMGLNFYLSEFLNEMFKNAPPNKNVYKLTDDYLNNLKPHNSYILHRGLSVKTLYFLGFISDFIVCSECGKACENHYISQTEGFIFCDHCKPKGSIEKLTHGVVLILQKMVKSEILELERIRVSESQKKEIDTALSFITKGILGKSLKSEHFLHLSK